MRTTRLVVVLAFAVGVGSASADVNQKAIDDVTAGRVKVAKASWWGFDPADSTKALQAAIDSGVPKLIVDRVGGPWIVLPIKLASDQEIEFEKGVEVVAKPGAFKGTNDCLFSAVLKQNITLTGYGATLRMQRSDYAGPDYKKAEWRHLLSFKSCTNVRVLGLTLAESGGDGVYLGTGKAGVTNKNVLLKDVVCDRNYRNGISVITAEDLLIEDCVLRDTGGTAPQAGIDYEPNGPDERLVNCVMRNCVVQANNGRGYLVSLNRMNAGSAPISLRFENCKAIGNMGTEVAVYTGNGRESSVKGTIEFVNCALEPTRLPGLVISDKPADGCHMRFEKCSIAAPAAGAPPQAPIVFMASQRAGEPLGGVEFLDCLVPDVRGVKPMALVDMAGGTALKGVTGTLVLQQGAEKREVVLTPQVLAEWMPSTGLKAIPLVKLTGLTLTPITPEVAVKPDALAFARLRQAARLALYAQQGDLVSLRVGYFRVAKYSGNPLPMIVRGPFGAEVKRVELPFLQETEVAFVAPETGLYHLAADPRLNYLQVTSCSHALNLVGDDQPIHFIASPGEVFFWVPAGTTEFGVRAWGEGLAEGLKAALVDPTGQVVEEKDNIAQTYQFVVTLRRPSPGEAWSLRISKPSKLVMEDHYVDLRGIPPLVAGSRDALLKP
jgi:hypothetical protein